MAGWALALSLAFCIPVAFLVAVGLAIAVLVRSRDGRDHGRGLAIAALEVSALIILGNVAYVVFVLVTGLDTTERDADGRVVEGGSVTVDRLQVGDCYDDPEFDASDGRDEGPGEAATQVEVVPCSEPHEAEVAHILELTGEDYPGRAAIDARSEDCFPTNRELARGVPFRRALGVYIIFPSTTTWRLGDRALLCIVTRTEGEPLTGSLAGAGRDR